MKQYRESMVYLMKAFSYGIFMFSCIYMIPATMETIFLDVTLGYTDRFYFLTGILAVLLAILLDRVITQYLKKNILFRYFLIIGIFVSIAISLAAYLWIQPKLLVFIFSIPYHAYSWKTGWDLENIEIKHEILREQFILQFWILSFVSVISSLFLNPAAMQTVLQFFTAYLILSLVLLRYSREFVNFNTQKYRRAAFINAGTITALIISILLVSTDDFISIASLLLIKVFTAVDSVLSFIVYIITYPIGYLLSALISLVNMIIGNIDIFTFLQSLMGDAKPSKGNGLPNINIDFGEASSTIGAVVFLILVFILFKILKKYQKQRKKTNKHNFTEKKEFIFSLSSVGRDLGNSLSPLFKWKNRSVPKTIRERIRYLYESFLEISIKLGIYKKSSQTHRDIKTLNIKFSDESTPDVNCITDIYEKARYSADELSEDDYNTAAGSLENIKKTNAV